METLRRSRRRTATKVKVEQAEAATQAGPSTSATTPTRKRKRVKRENAAVDGDFVASASKAKKQNVVKEEEELQSSAQNAQAVIKSEHSGDVVAQADLLSSAMPSLSEAEMFAFEGNSHWVGAHMSVSGGVENSVLNARLYGCQAWALFLKPKMQWDCKPLRDDNVRLFKEWMPKFKYDSTKRCLPHGSYLVNLANPDDEKRRRSLDAFIDDLKRCALLGIGLYNFHPGSGVGECSREEACKNIADCINASHAAFANAITPADPLHGLTCPVILLENMAGQGQQIGGTFEELAAVIAHVHDKSKVGVCIDTAHAFAAGMDIRKTEGYGDMMRRFDETVGMSYLKGMHLNDSAAALGSKKDRHANLGGGHLTLVPFHCIMNDSRLRHMPLVLETPAASWRVWQGEIQALYALQGLSVDDHQGWAAIEAKLAALRAIEKEMEKGDSLAQGSKAARRALEGKPPPKKRKIKAETDGETGKSSDARSKSTKKRSKKAST